jgi:inositol transporter-like SP family MFS transporter
METQPVAVAESSDASWKNTIFAAIANYIDAGSIVAGAAALSLWVEEYHLSTRFVGLLGAIGANAISAGIGAIIGGRLCDIFGRKTIYQANMLFYAVGMLWLVFAIHPWMIVVGFIQVGLAVGAAVPASWSLIADQAPQGARGQRSGVAQVLWYFGPVVVLLMSLALTPLGIFGTRIVFAHLAILAVILLLLRSRMQESERWKAAKAAAEESGRSKKGTHVSARELLKPKHLKSMAFLIGMYGTWNLWAGTNGFYLPYILRTVGAQSQAASVAFQALSFAIGIASIILVFMRLSDHVNQRLMYITASVIGIAGMSLLVLFPLTTPVALLYVLLTSFGGGFGAQPFFQLWSAELFPTLLRSTAQGISFAVVRIGLGFWSFFVPILTATGFTTLAWILTGFLVASGIIGGVWAPRNEGKSLEQIQAEL